MIREAQVVERVPFMLIVGEKEAADGTVSVRRREDGKTSVMTPEKFAEDIFGMIRRRDEEKRDFLDTV